jgi:hypothetical protein
MCRAFAIREEALLTLCIFKQPINLRLRRNAPQRESEPSNLAFTLFNDLRVRFSAAITPFGDCALKSPPPFRPHFDPRDSLAENSMKVPSAQEKSL